MKNNKITVLLLFILLSGLALLGVYFFQDELWILISIILVFALVSGSLVSALQMQINEQKAEINEIRQQILFETQSMATVLEKLIADLPIGIMLINADEKIRFNNQIWHDLIHQQGELKIANFRNYPGFWSAINRAIGTEDDVEYLWEIDHRFYQVRITPVHNGAQFIGVLVSSNDVSRFKQVEQVQQDFLADLTHELKTPIASLIGVGEILSEQGQHLTLPQLEDFHAIVYKESIRLNNLLDDLVDLTKWGNSSVKLKKSLFPLLKLVNEAKTMFEFELQNKGLYLKIDVDPQIRIFVDYQRFMQVMINLFSNAIRYTNTGGVSISAEKEDKNIVIIFQDSGMGIAPEYLERIFDRFFRTDEARTRFAGGTGLGLSIIKEIIKAHNGSINVNSQLGQGSEFIIRVPKI